VRLGSLPKPHLSEAKKAGRKPVRKGGPAAGTKTLSGGGNGRTTDKDWSGWDDKAINIKKITVAEQVTRGGGIYSKRTSS